MIIEIFERKNVRHPDKPIKTARIQCDVCGSIFYRDMHRWDSSKRHNCSCRCRQLGKSPTQEQRDAIRAKLTGLKRSAETRAKMSENNACHRPEIKEKLSRIRAQGIADGTISPVYRGNRGTYTSTKTHSIESFHSFLELDRMRTLDADDLVESWTKCHGHIIPYAFEGKTLHYTPDFMIVMTDGTVLLEEIKGWEGEIKLRFKMSALENYCLDKCMRMSYKNFKEVRSELNRFELTPTKGEKHQVVAKTKAAQVDATVAAGLKEFAELVVTEARCEQGCRLANGGELVFDMKNMGTFLKWMASDVAKECQAELEASGLDRKSAAKACGERAREWYMSKNKSL